jgi:hypothetical protein
VSDRDTLNGAAHQQHGAAWPCKLGGCGICALANAVAEKEREVAEWKQHYEKQCAGTKSRMEENASLLKRAEDAEQRVEGMQIALGTALERAEAAKEVVEGLLHQFAYDGPGPVLSTGGLSALEDGFEFVGWRDPHPIPESCCDEPGCTERISCGWPSPEGYRKTCSKHFEVPR